MSSRQVPLAERVALTLERHAKELCELTNRRMSADESEAVALAIPILVQLLKGGHGASAAALAIDHLAVNSAANQNAIREAGAIAPLVALLQAGAGSEAATIAAGALQNLANSNDTNKNAICEAGAIAPLVAMLQAGAGSEAATNAASALWDLAISNDTNRDAIREAGAIAPLVVLLQAGAGSKAATMAVGALWNLATSNDTNRNAIREAGAIAPLVALLQAGAGSEATFAAGALQNLSDSPTCSHAILAALADAATPLDAFPHLQRKLRSVATERLQRTEAGEDAAALEAALAMATAMGTTDEAVTARVHLRLVELRTAATRRARRESVGLNVALPADFTCPITYDKMKDPVVASDGHSYERSAIEEVLRGPHPISPLTRATLGTALVPNLNLRRRIEEHEAELDRMAEQMAARLASAVAEAESAANAKEAAAQAKEAAAYAEIEALQKQLADAKKRVRTEDDDTEEPWEEQDPPARKRRAPSSRRSTGSGAGGSA